MRPRGHGAQGCIATSADIKSRIAHWSSTPSAPATMSYPTYDTYDPTYDSYSRPRRPSLGYGPTTPASYKFPSYHDHLGTSYSEPMLRGEVLQTTYGH